MFHGQKLQDLIKRDLRQGNDKRHLRDLDGLFDHLFGDQDNFVYIFAENGFVGLNFFCGCNAGNDLFFAKLIGYLFRNLNIVLFGII